MKKFLKGLGAVIVALVLVMGGYFAGQRVQIGSIISAMPKKTIDNIPTESAPPEQSPSAVNVSDAVQAEKNIIEKNSASAIQDGFTEVTRMSPVSISDNIKADVMLYTSAKKDTDNQFLWDDGNQWVLEVNAGKGAYYTLLNKYVQLGKVDVMVGMDENGGCVITSVTSTGSGIVVEKYTYNGTAFEGQTAYNTGALNVWGSTF